MKHLAVIITSIAALAIALILVEGGALALLKIGPKLLLLAAAIGLVVHMVHLAVQHHTKDDKKP